MKTKICVIVFIYSTIILADITDKDTISSQLIKIQEAIEQKNAKWTASENRISKLPLEEKKLLFGTNEGSFKIDVGQKVDVPIVHDLPASFSWRDNYGNWLTPVKDHQPGQCGGCWVFSSVAQVESWWKIRNAMPDSMIDLSEQYMISCSPAGSCETGGWHSYALQWISQCGIPLEKCMPYMASDTIACESCCENWEEAAVKIPGWSYVTTDNADIMTIKNAVHRQPVTVHMDAYEDFVYYSGGVYEHVTGAYLAPHAVVIYGWDDIEQCWLCKESIGEDWGEEGHFRIKWGDCRVGTKTVIIWDEIADQGPFVVSPQNIEAEIELGTAVDTTITIKNNSSNNLEITPFIYGSESTFHPSPFNSYDSLSIWCGDENLHGYGNWWIKYLDTPVLDLSMTNTPEFSCLMKWSTDNSWWNSNMGFDGMDGGNMMISVDNGKNFELLVPESPAYNCDSLGSFYMYGIPFGTGGWSGIFNWQNVRADLSNYKSDSVIIRFIFATTNGNCTADNPAWQGLFIDSLFVKDNNTIIYENQGENIDDMRRSGLGGINCDWITILESTNIVAAEQSRQLRFTINAEELDTGNHHGSIVLSTNNAYYEYFEIPLNLIVREPTSVYSSKKILPRGFFVSQNYPNPFNPSTAIEFTLPKLVFVELKVYNILGNEVSTLVSNKLNQGNHTYIFDGTNLASGIYYYQLVAGDYREVKKMVLIR